MEHFNGPQTKFIGDSLFKHPVVKVEYQHQRVEGDPDPGLRSEEDQEVGGGVDHRQQRVGEHRADQRPGGGPAPGESRDIIIL